MRRILSAIAIWVVFATTVEAQFPAAPDYPWNGYQLAVPFAGNHGGFEPVAVPYPGYYGGSALSPGANTFEVYGNGQIVSSAFETSSIANPVREYSSLQNSPFGGLISTNAPWMLEKQEDKDEDDDEEQDSNPESKLAETKEAEARGIRPRRFEPGLEKSGKAPDTTTLRKGALHVTRISPHVIDFPAARTGSSGPQIAARGRAVLSKAALP